MWLCDQCDRVTNGRDTIWPHHTPPLLSNQSNVTGRGGEGGFCEAQGKGQVYQIFVIKEQIAQNWKKNC